jgi:quinol monooxygenase YgiN
MIGIYTRHTARAGRRADLIANLLHAGDLLEDNDACVHWVVNTTDDPDQVWVSAVWTSQAAHDAAVKSDEMRALMGEARHLLSETIMPEQVFVTPIGGKGI